MIEKQEINGREIWIKVDPHEVDRPNHNVIPTEYFTVSYYTQDPEAQAKGEMIKDENGEMKLFESPVAALTFAWSKLKETQVL